MTWQGRSIWLAILIVIALGIDFILIRYLIAQPLSFASAISLCVALIAALTIIVICVSGMIFKRWQGFGDTAQGLAAISAIVAFVVAANIYFLERKDKPRLEFQVSATRALIPAQGSSRASVLVGIRVLVRNNGSRRVELRCITLDMFRPAAGQPLVRNARSPEEMLLERVAEDASEQIAYPDRFDPECLRREEARKRLPRNSIRPLFGFSPITLEPSESDDGHFEIPVSCDFPFARALVKIRIRPEDELGYETKVIIPLREICEGNAAGMAESAVLGGLPSDGGEVPNPAAESTD